MKQVTLFLSALLVTLAAGVTAQETTGTGTAPDGTDEKTFTEMDGNRDGILTQSEVEQANFPGEFEELDRDDDGQVNRNEYYQYYRDQLNQDQ